MSIFLESLFVGLYTIIIYSIITFLKLKINIYQKLFIVGFFKHFLGYVLGLHKLYIDYGYACKNYLSKNIKNDTIPTQTIYNYLLLFISSVFEGFCFLFIGFFIDYFNFVNIKNVRNNIIIYFFIGFLFHLFAEYFGIHKMYCKLFNQIL